MNDFDFGLYVEDAELSAFAEASARLLSLSGTVSASSVVKEMRRSYLAVKQAYDDIRRRFADAASAPPACRWLLDNFYLIQREVETARGELSSVRRMRRCDAGALALECCKILVRTGGCGISRERCTLFLRGFQRVIPLERQELSLFPALLRAALIAAAAELCTLPDTGGDRGSKAQLFEALFASLRFLAVTEGHRLTDDADRVNSILSADPTGEYSRMDSDTRRAYLERLSRLAKKEGTDEYAYAEALLQKAISENRHVGFALFPPVGQGRAAAYIGANVLLTAFISLLAGFSLRSAPAAMLLVIPVSELVKTLIDFILRRFVPPVRLPRMDVEQGIAPEGRTLVVISAILGSPGDARRLAARLEELRLASKSEGDVLSFGLLADLPGARSKNAEGDAASINAARAEIAALNGRYGGGFYLFTRRRSYDGESWNGHERKRGALLELAKLLAGRENELLCDEDVSVLAGTEYILTLDSDTSIYPGSVGQLIAAALHPLCKPIIDHDRHIVSAGYGILHPRISIDLADANATDFALIFTPGGGSDPYGALCGELTMDLFGEGGFAGKGLIYAPALLECSEAHIREGRILSHDAVEGAYLRGAYMGDTEFSDGFPVGVAAFFRRQQRWVRGDWQNLPYLFHRELSAVSRWKLFDSIRRSLVPPVTLCALLAGFLLPGRASAVAAWAALAALIQRLLVSLAESGFARREKIRLRRYTRLLTGFGGAIVETFMRLWLLPYESWVNFSASVLALWRMGVSRKRLLEWQTATHGSTGADGFGAHIRAMWFPAVLGAGLLFFCPVIIARSAGLLWLLSPVMAAALSLPAYRETPLTRQDRAFLIRTAGQSWKYYEHFCTAEDNFLPPDNFQEQPPVGLAHRTSPTNIGLAFSSAAAVTDMGILDGRRCVEFCERILCTLEKMPRALGHFYNWYDTRTLTPLTPTFISTVDSGNLYAGLSVARSLMEELDEPELAQRFSRLMEEMDFRPLYDPERGLFHICYDTTKNAGAGGYYDLMASEAMLTSYIAIAKGDVPVKHWRRLNRAQLQKDGYRGLASWTGTMFEYLMPELFLEVFRGSLLYESARFCVYAQRRRVNPGQPWGISESAFFLLDSAMSYRYKAHGVGALALKRGQDEETVVSPYSSYLALCTEPVSAVRNLRRLEGMGAYSRFGFIEALDYTPGRCRSRSGEAVRCYMAHHIGMSITAAANAVCGGSIRKRFMGDSSMRSFALLLQERLPENGAVIRRDDGEVPERPRDNRTKFWRTRGSGDRDGEGCCLLSNGAYCVMSTSLGLSRATFGSVAIYDYAETAPLSVSISKGDASLTILPAQDAELWELTENSHSVHTRADHILCCVDSVTAAGEWGELRTVSLESGEDVYVSVTLSFEPMLAEISDYVNHPSFWRLGLEAELDHGCLLLRRLKRGDKRELWLCLACDADAEYSADRHGGTGALSAPFVTATAGVELCAGEKSVLRFALCVGLDRREAMDGAKRILSSQGRDRGSMVGAAAALLGLDETGIDKAMKLLPSLLFARPVNACGKQELWQYGISGDMPLIACDSENAEAAELLKHFCLLKSAGAECELVYFTDEQGEYRRPFFRKISEALGECGLEALAESRGGVHFLPLSARRSVESRAVVINGKGLPPVIPSLKQYRQIEKVPVYTVGKEFEYYVNRSLPRRAWQLPMSNGSFGLIAADFGCGAMWYKNAREMAVLSPADVYDAEGKQNLSTEYKGRQISLFAAGDGFPCRVRYGQGYARWEKSIGGAELTVTTFIPKDTDAQVIVLQGGAGRKIRFSFSPVMGGGKESLVLSSGNGRLQAENGESWYEGAKLTVSVSEAAELFTDAEKGVITAQFTASECSIIVCSTEAEEKVFELCKPSVALSSLENVKRVWDAFLGAVQISCSNEKLCNYVNYWCAYQTVACRLDARSSLYQSGGAFGFRDQLQDAVNMILLDPQPARDRILDCCRHQYAEGDVMHWWHVHPQGDKGIRSRCSDDLLWLVWALCRYTRCTGDLSLCSCVESYVCSPVLDDDERDRYETPERSRHSEPVIDHAIKAVERCVSRGFGPHGLPWMGSGDWNDGYDAAEGESVWLAWFLACCAHELATLLDTLCKPGGERYRKLALSCAKAAERSFNGRFYLRGYLPDGSPLGGSERVDSVCQSWAALCPLADQDHARLAVEYALCKLFDRDNSLVKLFSPPYGEDDPYVGYISSYGKGFRENGGQYTHGAIWLALGCLALDKRNEAWELLTALLPEGREEYEAEPFVLAADVYTASGHVGEAGWSWYTGSAGWYYRAVTEGVFGMELRDGRLELCPRLPDGMDSAEIRWTDRSGIVRSVSYTGREIHVDGKKYDGKPVGD